jgi:3-oxosteroid 1-dehydrogenase
MADEWDVVVVGCGAAGLAAAIAAADSGASVVVLEASEQVGGASAFSGGLVWLPGRGALADGRYDGAGPVLEYLDALNHGDVFDAEAVSRFVLDALPVRDRLQALAPMALSCAVTASDYHADLAGGAFTGRSFEVDPVPARALLGAEWATRIRSHPVPALELTLDEGAAIQASRDAGTTSPIDARSTIAARRAEMVLTGGPGLVAGLLAGALRARVEIRLGTRADELLLGEGRVGGVRAHRGDAEQTFHAAGGVILATGGFEWDESLVARFIGHPIAAASPPTSRGDGLRMGVVAGASVSGLHRYWGMPVVGDPTTRYDERAYYQAAHFRSSPGTIIVNDAGSRFVNEGASYHTIVDAFHEVEVGSGRRRNPSPGWLLFDDDARRRTRALASVAAAAGEGGWGVVADSLDELAASIAVEPGALGTTVDDFNRGVRAGVDRFGRGTAWFEGFLAGGPGVDRSLAPMSAPPFHAVRIHDGTIGTSGGLVIDPDARVQGWDGQPIEGLYAAGNATASIFAGRYPGAGATLGPALVHGFLAGTDAARRAASRRTVVSSRLSG